MSFIAVGLSVGGSLLGGALAAQGSKKAGQAAAQSSKEDREFAERMYGKQIKDMRSNQSSDFGDLTWKQDPATGQWTQTNKMNEAEAARLGDFRQIAADRMAGAKAMSANLPQGATNYEALGLGKYASASGVQGGGTSDNPNAGRKYSVPNYGGPIGQPSWGQGNRPPTGGGMALGGGAPQQSGPLPPMQQPTQPPPMGGDGGPGPAGMPGGRQPYQPTPIVPPPAAGAAPPPAAAAPPPEAKPGPDLNSYLLNDNGVYAPSGNEGAVLAEMQKHDPNAYWKNAAMDGTDSAQQGRQLVFNKDIISGLLRK